MVVEVLPTHRRSRAGFTLIEMLLALAISAIVLAAIGGVFFGAFRLRERTTALLDQTAPLCQALARVRRDLRGTLPPSGYLAGDFKCAPLGGGGANQSFSLQFSTTTGQPQAGVAGCDIQEIIYELRDSAAGGFRGGKDLIRSVVRNVLTAGILETEDQLVLGRVESLEFACYDGFQWRDTWDTSLSDTNLPSAVRLRLRLSAPDLSRGIDTGEPIELVVPLLCQSRTNHLSAGEGSE